MNAPEAYRRPSSPDFPYLIYIIVSTLPAGLANAGDLALVSQLTEADTANTVVAQVSVGTAADLAAVVAAGRELSLSLLLLDHRLSCHVRSSNQA